MGTMLSNQTAFRPIPPYPVFFDSVANTFVYFSDVLKAMVPFNSTPPNGTVTLTSGTAVQNAGSTWATYYVCITGGASGTVKIDIGPTSAAAINVVPLVAGNAVTSHIVPVRVPPGYFLKVTTAAATINSGTVYVQETL